jgi:uncharacterized membrane protein
MGLATLIVGLTIFIGGHLFITARGPRAALISRLGEWPYKGLFSVVATVGVILIGYGFAQYRAAGMINVWYPPDWTRHVTAALMWPAVVGVVAAYIPGNIKRVLKHPMLVGVKLWAVAHLIANGDLGSIILFGAILAWAVIDRIALKRRAEAPASWIPVGGWPSDVIAVIIGTIAYLALGLLFHPIVIGVPVFGR